MIDEWTDRQVKHTLPSVNCCMMYNDKHLSSKIKRIQTLMFLRLVEKMKKTPENFFLYCWSSVFWKMYKHVYFKVFFIICLPIYT